MTDVVQVSTATASRQDAEQLAEAVVTARLAAGAQIVGPVVSVFWHQGEFGTGEEWQLLFKTRADRCADLEAHLPQHHPWTNPMRPPSGVPGIDRRRLQLLDLPGCKAGGIHEPRKVKGPAAAPPGCGRSAKGAGPT